MHGRYCTLSHMLMQGDLKFTQNLSIVRTGITPGLSMEKLCNRSKRHASD